MRAARIFEDLSLRVDELAVPAPGPGEALVRIQAAGVCGTDRSPMKQKLLGSIVGLCRDLGIEIIAEGIETPAERDALVRVGGDLCQGYLFARPEKPWAAINFDR